jgi:hypothetical protein
LENNTFGAQRGRGLWRLQAARRALSAAYRGLVEKDLNQVKLNGLRDRPSGWSIAIKKIGRSGKARSARAAPLRPMTSQKW